MDKKEKLLKEKLKVLEGFEDILDLLDEDTPLKKGAVTNDKLADNYQLYNFLENEIRRLSALVNFFTKKTDNLEHAQTEMLIDNQKIEIIQCKKVLINHLKQPNQPLRKRIEFIWDSAFSKGPKGPRLNEI